MIPTHAFTLNGRTSLEVDDAQRPVHDEIRHRLQLLDATSRYSIILWAIPRDVPFDMVDPDTVEEYLQCAGSAERMTVEIRRLVDGVARQEVIGRPGGTGGEPGAPGADKPVAAEPDVAIPWNGYEARVYPNEVFDSEEAAHLFISYYDTGDVPSSYARRTLTLSQETG